MDTIARTYDGWAMVVLQLHKGGRGGGAVEGVFMTDPGPVPRDGSCRMMLDDEVATHRAIDRGVRQIRNAAEGTCSPNP